MMTKQALTPEEAKHLRIIREYTELVTSSANHLGLCGYQPKLTKVREAYQAGQVSDSDLQLVLNNLAIDLQGEAESFRDKKHAWSYMFGDTKLTTKPSPIVLSIAEQAIAIKDILGDDLKKKYTGPRRKAVKKTEAINVSALPEALRHLVK